MKVIVQYISQISPLKLTAVILFLLSIFFMAASLAI